MFEGEDGGASGAASAGDPEAAAAAASAASTAWTPPAGLPAEFVGKDAAETLGKLAPAFAETHQRAEGLRSKLAGMPAPPKSPDEYQFKPDEKIAMFFGDVAKNPGLKAARESAHKLGLSNDQLNGLINGVYGPMAEKGQLLPPLDQAAELKGYMKHAGVDKAGADADFAANEQFAKGLLAQLKLPNDPAITAEAEGIFGMMQDTAVGNLIFKALAARFMDSGIHITGVGANSGALFSESELAKMHTDPRIDPRNKGNADMARRYDPDLRDKYDRSQRAIVAAKQT